MQTGVVKFYNKDKKYGFIVDDNSQRDVFFHISGVTEEVDMNKNDKVSYTTKESPKGTIAVDVKKIGVEVGRY